MKSTPRCGHRARRVLRACQGKGRTDASHDRAAKRVRACPGNGELVRP